MQARNILTHEMFAPRPQQKQLRAPQEGKVPTSLF